MKHILVATFITLLALGTGCAWISPAAETASDGINVHGHWTVTVTNPDGSVDAVHEFENALNPAASEALTALIMGNASINYWLMFLFFEGQNPQNAKCLEGTSLGYNWILTDELGSSMLDYGVPSVTAIRDITTEGKPIKISGHCTLITDGPSEIEQVATKFHLTPPVWGGLFTLTGDEFTPIPIANGNKLSFTVIISFN